MTWGWTYFDHFILSMSSLQTTYHNIRAVNGVKTWGTREDEEIWVKTLHKAINQYMHMVGVMCLHIRAVQTGNWALHISALEDFANIFSHWASSIMPGWFPYI